MERMGAFRIRQLRSPALGSTRRPQVYEDVGRAPFSSARLHLHPHLLTLSFHRSTELTTPHSIISVTTYSAILSSPDAQRDKLTGSKKPILAGVAASSWTWTFLKLFLFAGVCVGAIYGYQEYTKRNGGGFGGNSFGRRRGGGLDVFSSAKRF